jgi:hypothetical protein
MRRWESALATHFGIEGKRLTLILSAMEKHPGAQRADLESRSRACPTAPSQARRGRCRRQSIPYRGRLTPTHPSPRDPAIPPDPRCLGPAPAAREAAERLARAAGWPAGSPQWTGFPWATTWKPEPLPQDEDMDLRAPSGGCSPPPPGRWTPNLARSMPGDLPLAPGVSQGGGHGRIRLSHPGGGRPPRLHPPRRARPPWSPGHCCTCCRTRAGRPLPGTGAARRPARSSDAVAYRHLPRRPTEGGGG